MIIKVIGKDIINFIYRMHYLKINLLHIDIISFNEANILINSKDYNMILENKNTYDISVIKYSGIGRFFMIYKKFKYLIYSIIIGIVLLFILSNIIYTINIESYDTELINIINSSLKKYGVVKYHFKKSYDELEYISNEILKEYPDKLEWLTIEEVGTKYIVRFEKRIINIKEEDNRIYDIVASKDAILMRIDATKGEVIGYKNKHVKKGDVIISSEIKLFDEVKSRVSAKGSIYGQTWKTVHIEFPLKYSEYIKTGKFKKVYNIKIFSKYIGKKSYKDMETKDYTILKGNIFPISINKQIQNEIVMKEYNLSYEEGIKKALEYARETIQKKLSKEEYIIDEKSLKCDTKDSKIILDIFYSVYEDITEYKEIEG